MNCTQRLDKALVDQRKAMLMYVTSQSMGGDYVMRLEDITKAKHVELWLDSVLVEALALVSGMGCGRRERGRDSPCSCPLNVCSYTAKRALLMKHTRKSEPKIMGQDELFGDVSINC